MTSLAAFSYFDYPAAVAGQGGKWIKLLPAGKFRLRDGRGGQLDTGDLASMRQIVDRTRHFFGATDIMVDYDHELVRATRREGRAEAAGWIKELEARPDGIYGRVEWTAAAADKIAAKAYRYISPWFSAAKDGRVFRLMNAALVNMPALDLIAANLKVTDMNEPTLEDQLRELLALGTEADQAAILEAVRALTTRAETASATPDPAQYVPMGMFAKAVAEANSLRAGVAQADAERMVSAAISSGAMIPALESWAVDLCTKNLPAFQSFLASTGPALMTVFSTSQSAYARRNAEGTGNDNELNAMEQTIAAALDLSSQDFIAAKGGKER